MPHDLWWLVNIGSGNGFLPWGTKPLPEPVLIKISQRLPCHMSSLGHNELFFQYLLKWPNISFGWVLRWSSFMHAGPTLQNAIIRSHGGNVACVNMFFCFPCGISLVSTSVAHTRGLFQYKDCLFRHTSRDFCYTDTVRQSADIILTVQIQCYDMAFIVRSFEKPVSI